jgi:hypothetical protein
MTIVQSKLKEVLDKGSLNSLDRLSVVLQTNELCETETGNEPMDDVLPDVDVEEEPVVAKGENKVPTKKRKHQKYRLQKKPRGEPSHGSIVNSKTKKGSLALDSSLSPVTNVAMELARVIFKIGDEWSKVL